MLVVRREQQQLGRVRGAAGEHDEVAGVASRARRRRSTTTSGHRRAAAFVSSLIAARVRQQRTFGCSSAGRTPSTSASDLPCTAHGKPSQFAQRTQRAVRHVRLVEPDAARRVERVVARRRRDRRRAAGSAARARRPGTGTARSPAARSGPRRGRRAPGTAARPACSTARARRRRSATRARCRRGGAARRSPPRAAGRARRRRASSRRRRSSGSAAGTACRCRRTTCPARRSGCRRTRRCASQFCGSRGSQSPRSSSRIRLPDGARWRASVPPPAPRADDDHVVVAHAVLRHPLGHDDPRRRLDQREVREGLREVAEVPAGRRRRTPRRRARAARRSRSSRSIRSRARCSSPTIASADTSQNEQIRNVPSLPGEAVVGLLGAVAQDEAVLGQLVGDREDACCAGARRRRAGSRRSPRAGSRRRASRSRSAGAGRRVADAVREHVVA